MPKHGAAYKFVSTVYTSDKLRFQSVDLGDTTGLSIKVFEDDSTFPSEVTLGLDQLSEFAAAMFAALHQAGQIAVDKHSRLILGLLTSGIAENPFKAKEGA